jgi:ABC transporter with metal-binding/Fe-S-binding domain ATP-binding protein
MFHTPNINLTEKQAEVMNIPLITHKTPGEKEEELKDLGEAIKIAKDEYKIQGVVTGALHSEYQKSRIQKICDKLELGCINPLWHIDAEKYWKELIKNKFEIMIVGVASDGLDKEWLGKIINNKAFEKLKQLKEKFKFHLAFEGGEAETFITDCPLFKKRIKVIKAAKVWEGNSGKYKIKKVELIEK